MTCLPGDETDLRQYGRRDGFAVCSRPPCILRACCAPA